MDICVLSIGKTSSYWISQGLDIFEKRIPKYVKFSSIIIPDIKKGNAISKENIKEEEGKFILSHLNASDFVALMDERGKEFTSREFSDWIQKQMNSGRKRMIFIIGGPYGFSQKVYDRADIKICLSRMTFTHEMARTFALEQIYRAMTILRGEPYHHD